MKKLALKIILPVVALGVGIVGMGTIKATANQETDKEVVDTRPTVRVEALLAEDYPVVISSFGEVKPLEKTLVAAQVSGEVVSWHQDFLPGGLIQRGDVMFSIEKDSYEAALLQAEADVSQARSQLIEERARAEVAKNEARNLPASKVTDLYLRKPQVLSAEANLKSAEARLKIAQRDLANCDVVAPYDALVVTRTLGTGQYVNQGAQVAEIYNIETAEISVPVAGFDSAFLPDVIQGRQAIVQHKGIRSFERTGVIARDLGVVDEGTRMSQLVIRVQDPYSLNSDQPALKFGSYVEVDFAGRTLKDVFRLPQELVNNRTVWLVDKESKLLAKRVEILREEGEFFLISEGLENEDRLVMTLPEYPQNGMQVKLAGEATDLVAQKGE